MENIFLEAASKKFRFDTPKGQIRVEDLFDLPLTTKVGAPNLNDIAIDLYEQSTTAKATISFVDTVSPARSDIITKLEIVKAVIAIKKKQLEDRVLAEHKVEKKRVLLAALEAKEQSSINAMSKEDIIKALSEL